MRNQEDFVLIEVNESEFMPVTKAQNALDFKTRPVGAVKYLMPELKEMAKKMDGFSGFKNPYLLQKIK